MATVNMGLQLQIETTNNRSFLFDKGPAPAGRQKKEISYYRELIKFLSSNTKSGSPNNLDHLLRLVNPTAKPSPESLEMIVKALYDEKIIVEEKIKQHIAPEADNTEASIEIYEVDSLPAKTTKKAAKKKVVKEESGENLCTSKGGTTQGNSSPTADKTPTAGDPVSMITGEELLQLTDFEMPGPLALVWERTYRSTAANIDNGLGFGWGTVFDTEIIVDATPDGLGGVIYRDAESREIPFPLPNPGFESRQPFENLVLRCEGSNEYTIIFPDGTHHVFRPQAGRFRVSHISTPRGNALECLYTDKGNISRIDNRAGRCVFIERQKSGHISAIVVGTVNEKNRKAEALKHTYVRYRYDEEFNLIEAIDACDNSEKYEYNNHIIIKRSLRSGFNLHFEWDNHSVLGKCLRQYGDNGYYDYSFEYKPEVRKSFSRDGRGIKTGYEYSSKGLLLEQAVGKGAPSTKKYDEIGRLIETIDPNGIKSKINYDEDGKLAEVIDARGSSTSYRYNEIDDPIFMTDAEGNVWERKFDPFGNIVELTDPAGRTTLYEYNLNGTLSQITYPEGRVRKLIWNEKAEFVGDWDIKTNSLSEYLYDDLGRMTHSLTADGDLTRYEYDAMGRVTCIAQGVSLNDYETPLDDVGNEDNSRVSKQKFIYNADGRLSQYIDSMGNITRYGYDGLAHVRKKTMPDGSTFEYLYDEERNLVGLINENGERYRLSYDENENITREVGFDGRTQHYEYDAAGHLVFHKDGESREITYERDELGNLTKRISKDTQTGEQEICEYTYDRLNRLIHADNNHKRLQFNYDGVGNLLEEWQDDQCITHKYDGDNNRTSTTLSDGDSINYRYNHKGECTGIQFNEQEVIAIERNLRGLESKRTLGSQDGNSNAISIDKHYDPQGRLTQQRTFNDSNTESPILEKLYQYDSCGHITQSKQLSTYDPEKTKGETNLTSINLNGTTDFKYDTLGQLIHADGFTEEVFKLDPAGNLIDSKAGEQQSLDGNRLSQYKGQEFEFDGLGNITQRIDQKSGHKTTFRYNAENQLLETKKAGLTTRYKYDALGRRIQKKDDTGTIDFIWDGDVLITEKRANSKKVYIHEPNTFRPVAQIQNQNIYHYHLDHIGTPQEITDQQGNLVWQANYSSYGKVISRKVAQIQNNLRFQGQYYDEESDLHYNRHRYFDPSTGRYIHQDPIGLLGGKNAYIYCKNPTSYTDALGLSAAKESPDRSKNAQERKQNPSTDNKGSGGVNEENHDTHSVSSTGEVKAKQDAPPAAPAASSNSTVQCEKTYWIEYQFVDSAGNPVQGLAYHFEDCEQSEEDSKLGSDGTIKRKLLAQSGECVAKIQYLTNAKWSQEEARTGDIVKLTADAVGFEDGEKAKITIYEMDHDGNDDFIEELEAEVQGEKIKAQWEYYYTPDDDDVVEDKKTEKRGYTTPEYYFVPEVLGQKTRSPLIEFKDYITINLVNDEDQSIKNAEYIIELGGGKIIKGNLDDNGHAKIENIPPGKYKVSFPDFEHYELEK